MPLVKHSILLLKSEKTDESSDKYQDLLEANNFKVMMVKTLVFQYKNIDLLKEKLLNADKFSGIILSSPRCVNAVSLALEKERICELWKSKYNFTVGEATYRDGLEKLGVDCEGKESGNAKNLAQIIIHNKSKFTKPFLFPHGSLKTDTLKLELRKENLILEEVLVYDTLPNPKIEEELKKCTNGFTDFPEFLVFFSPSGLHSSLTYLLQNETDLRAAKIIAIGPVTQLAVEEQGLHVHGIAKSPTPEEVLKVIV